MKLYETPQTKNAGYIRARPIKPIGIFVHSTGASNPELKRYVDASDLLGKNTHDNHWNRETSKKSMHGFIGLDINKEVAVCHTLPYNIACWGAGGGSRGSYNYDPQAHVQFEVCEDSSPRSGKPPTPEQTEYYKAAWLAAEEYCAYLCELLKLPASSIVGHYEAAKRGYASYHSDPENWMKIYGDSMDKFRARVAERLNRMKVNIKLTQKANADFHKVNVGDVISLDVETYLLGVVPAEIGNSNIEACRAQAIASRSILLSGRWGVITDTTQHQAYTAPLSIDPAFFRAHQAVKDTQGVVLLYKGEIAATFFADSNGGMMKASDEHWNQNTPYEQREHIPYLVTKPDPWTAASGKPYSGHPVGMSQQGAIWAANQGINYKQILAFYYPGTVLSNEGSEQVNLTGHLATVQTRNDAGLFLWDTIEKNWQLIQVRKGETLEVVKDHENGWVTAKYKGVQGFADKQYLEDKGIIPVPNDPEPADTVQIPRAAWDAFLEAFERVLKAVG